MPDTNLNLAALQLPCSVVIISAGADGKQGAMTATAMYVSMIPPRVTVSLSRTFATYQLIEKSGQFAINVIADNQVELSRQFGSSHGFETDKFKEFNIRLEAASKITAPLIAGCFSHVECRIKTSFWEVEGNHVVYLAEPVAYKVDRQLRPMVWFNGKYFSVGSECKIPS